MQGINQFINNLKTKLCKLEFVPNVEVINVMALHFSRMSIYVIVAAKMKRLDY
jgi:hypothetical protein